MIIWFRKQRKTLAAVMVIAFTGGYSTFFCPDCQANAVPGMTTMSESDYNHCSRMQKDLEMKNPDQPGTHCPESSVCGDQNLMVADKRLITVNGDRMLIQVSAVTETKSIQPDLLTASKTYLTGRPYKPDRACYKPLERNCVLLN